MVDVDTGVDDVDVDAVTTVTVVLVLGEGGEGEPGTVTNSGKTLFIWRQIRRVTLPKTAKRNIPKAPTSES